jgi:hypothetical protein
MNRLPLEISHQKLPGVAVGELDYFEFAPSLPLHELTGQAPAFADMPFQPRLVGFPYANDESAIYWQQAAARTGTSEYQTATNRTALVVGESSLTSSLPYIPEDTIVAVDSNPHSCAYMQHYVDSLRTAPTIKEWHRQMAHRLNPDFNGDTDALYQEDVIGLKLGRQIRQWQEADLKHGLDDEETYKRSSWLARQKAIIPWRADLQDQTDMQLLAQTLRAHRATVTMINLANVVDCLKRSFGPLALEDLPVAEHAPILATSMVAEPRDVRRLMKEIRAQKEAQKPENQADSEAEQPFGPTYLAGATGPFFGLRNFFEQGGSELIFDSEERRCHAVYRRLYHRATDTEQQQQAA